MRHFFTILVLILTLSLSTTTFTSCSSNDYTEQVESDKQTINSVLDFTIQNYSDISYAFSTNKVRIDFKNSTLTINGKKHEIKDVDNRSNGTDIAIYFYIYRADGVTFDCGTKYNKKNVTYTRCSFEKIGNRDYYYLEINQPHYQYRLK